MVQKSLPRPVDVSPAYKPILSFAIRSGAIILTTLAVFFQDLTMIFSDALQSEETSFVFIVLMLLVYLIYRKRRMIRATVFPEPFEHARGFPFHEIAGAFLFSAAFLLYWYGSYRSAPLQYHMLTLPIYVAACILILFNARVLRQVLFPVALLFLLSPAPEAFNNFGSLFSSFSSVYLQIEFFVFALFVAYIVPGKLWKKAAVFLCELSFIYLLDIVHYASTGFVGRYFGEGPMLNLFRLFGGWTLILVGTVVLLMGVERLLRIHIFRGQKEKCPDPSHRQVTERTFCFMCGRMLTRRFGRFRWKDLAKAAVLVLSVFLLLSIQIPVFALAQMPSIVVMAPSGQGASADFLPIIQNYTLSFYGVQSEPQSGGDPNLVFSYRYSPANASDYVVWVVVEIASNRSFLHNWETLLVTRPAAEGRPVRVSTIESRDVQLATNPPITARYFSFRYVLTNATQAVLYWYENVGFAVNSSVQQKYAKISVEVLPKRLEDLAPLESKLMGSAEEIADYWQPVKTLSQIQFVVSDQGDMFFVLAAIVPVGLVILRLYGNRRVRKQNRIAYGKLPSESKAVVDAVFQTKKKTLPTLNDISTTYTQITGKPVVSEDMVRKLSEAEEIGIIKKEIAGKRDEPYLIWKAEI